MGPTVEELNKVLNIKKQIKQSIINRGVEITDTTPFADYPSKIDSIEAGGSDPYYEEFYNLRTNNGTSMDAMFARTTGELDLRKVDTSNITSMYYMFDYSSATVNIDGWDTSNVTDMSYMFNNFTGSIDISKLDTSNVTNASYMFYYANTDKIILTGLSFPKCTKLDNMFYSATGTTLDLSSWDISNVTNINSMFAGSFTRIDLTGWNTSHVTNMGSLFYKYSNPLVELIIPNWDMSNYSGNIFYQSSYIPNLKLIDLSESNDATITKMASYLPTRTTTTYGKVLVPYDTSQATYDALVTKYWAPLGASMTPNITSYVIISDLDEIFPGKSRKIKAYLGDYEPWNGDPTKTELVMVSDSSIATMDENNIITTTGVLGDIIVQVRIKDTEEVISEKIIPVTETDSYPNLVKFRVSSTPSSYGTLITVNGTTKTLSALTYDSMTNIYSYDNGAPITNIKFSNNSYINELIKLNTSNITDMSNMFSGCSAFTSLDLSSFDTRNTTKMSRMFSGCRQLTSLDLSSFDTSNVTDMTYMFDDCSKLTTIDLSNWNTSKVTYMGAMFQKCSSLIDLDLSNFDTSNVTDMSLMFNSCNSLTNLIAPKNISADLDLSSCKKITHDSLMSIINNLATVTTTKKLTVGFSNLSKISNEDIAIATNKGWTVKV